MNVKTIGLCRGSRKVFVLIEITGAAAKNTIALAPDPTTDVQVPSSLYPFGNDDEVDVANCSASNKQFVVVFPDLAIPEAHVVLLEKDAMGNIIAQAPYILNYAQAKWTSRLNYKIKPDLCKKIRDYDKDHTALNSFMCFDECIVDHQGFSALVRGKIYLPLEIESSVTLLAYDTQMNVISSHTTYLRDSNTNSGNYVSLCFREIHFSVEVPHHYQDFLFIASYKDRCSEEESSKRLFNMLPREIFSGMIHDYIDKSTSAWRDPNYDKWFRTCHKAKPNLLSLQRKQVFDGPSFSIICPLYKTPLNFFEDMLHSVEVQTYSNWELILVNASKENRPLKKAVNKALAADPRVKAIELESNKGISENTNAGVAIATGDFVCFLDHDDFIEPDTLYEYASAIIKNNNIDLLYCDEDKYQLNKKHKGIFIVPHFKPNFNIDLLRCCNYISHFLCIRKTLWDTLIPPTADYDGAQDYHMTLQAVERARAIHHVPKVLYHWRIGNLSTAYNPDTKPYTIKAGINALAAHVKRMNINAEVTSNQKYPNYYDINYRLPDIHPLISIIIPNKDSREILERCISSILERSTYDNYEIIVVENNSTKQETFTYYQLIATEHPQNIHIVTFLGDGNFNFSKLINFGVENATGDYLLLLNNDTEVITPNWIEEMLGLCLRDDVGVVGARLLFPDDTIQHAGINCNRAFTHIGRSVKRLGIKRLFEGDHALLDCVQDLSAVTAACCMTKRSVFDKVGGFDENLAVSFNDVDYCLNVRNKDYLVVYTPKAELCHYESYSRGNDRDKKAQMRLFKETHTIFLKHPEYSIYGDPYININLSADFCLRDNYHLPVF